DASLAEAVMPGLHADGKIVAGLTIGGTLAHPRFDGSAELKSIQFRSEDFPQSVVLNGTILVTPERVTLDKVRADVGGGTLAASGEIALGAERPGSFSFTLEGK